jgi:adenylylsulfate kinase-like enzyme
VGKTSKCGRVIWITGLSGSGKTTLMRALVERLRSSFVPTVALDGDEIRQLFVNSDSDEERYSRAARLELSFRYSKLSRVLASQGVTVVISTISLFREIHQFNRASLPGYFEVYLDTPIEELRRRDPKGIYARFDSGKLKNVAGLDLEVDIPEAPHYRIKFEKNQSVVDLVSDLLMTLQSN